MRIITGVTLAAATFLSAGSATAQTPFPITISGNKAEVRIESSAGLLRPTSPSCSRAPSASIPRPSL